MMVVQRSYHIGMNPLYPAQTYLFYFHAIGPADSAVVYVKHIQIKAGKGKGVVNRGFRLEGNVRF